MSVAPHVVTLRAGAYPHHGGIGLRRLDEIEGAAALAASPIGIRTFAILQDGKWRMLEPRTSRSAKRNARTLPDRPSQFAVARKKFAVPLRREFDKEA
jgi:hypothetical protein